MKQGAHTRLRMWAFLAVALLVATSAWGAGFSIFEQGSRAHGMAGAFTAQADDGSALFHNVAGIGFQHEKSFTLGITFITISSSEFQGSDPFPGANATGSQASAVFFPPHAYYVRPISDFWTMGVSFNTPFGLATKWDDVDNWSGRYLSHEVEIRALDFGFHLGGQLTENFAVGASIIARGSDIVLQQRMPQINPFTQSVVDVGNAELTSDLDWGFGYQIGLLHKVTNSMSWGFTYRGPVEIDFSGDGVFTQISTGSPQFDAAVAAVIPFGSDRPMQTSIEFPDTASLGLALRFTENTVVEVDVNWTGWSTFDVVVIDFTNAEDGAFDSVREQNWDDVMNYRIGFAWTLSPTSELRLGYVFDESPQPAETVSPLLPDADRNGITVGWGHQGSRFNTDISLMYLPFDESTTEGRNLDNFDGTYDTTAWLLGTTLSF